MTNNKPQVKKYLSPEEITGHDQAYLEGLTATEASHTLEQLATSWRSDPQHPYRNPQHPQHGEYQRYIDQLRKRGAIEI